MSKAERTITRLKANGAVTITLGELRRSLALIGTGHDDKPVCILVNKPGNVLGMEQTIAVQGDRILIDATKI